MTKNDTILSYQGEPKENSNIKNQLKSRLVSYQNQNPSQNNTKLLIFSLLTKLLRGLESKKHTKN